MTQKFEIILKNYQRCFVKIFLAQLNHKFNAKAKKKKKRKITKPSHGLFFLSQEIVSYIGPIFVLHFEWEKAEKIKLQGILFLCQLYSLGLFFLSLPFPNSVPLDLTQKTQKKGKLSSIKQIFTCDKNTGPDGLHTCQEHS